MEIGAIAYGSWDLDARTVCLPTCTPGANRASSLSAAWWAMTSARSSPSSSWRPMSREDNYNGKEVRGNVNIIKPLWNPAPLEAPLK